MFTNGEKMNTNPEIHCDAWKDGEEIPIEYTAPKEPNIQAPGGQQPENRIPNFTFANVPDGTQAIALVVHDVLDGEPVEGARPGWTHYIAIMSPEGRLLKEGTTDEDETGWVGPYPERSGEYHCTAYFLSDEFPEIEITRTNILKLFGSHGLGSVNMVGKYTNPRSISK